jgi:hypothetical protein
MTSLIGQPRRKLNPPRLKAPLFNEIHRIGREIRLAAGVIGSIAPAGEPAARAGRLFASANDSAPRAIGLSVDVIDAPANAMGLIADAECSLARASDLVASARDACAFAVG